MLNLYNTLQQHKYHTTPCNTKNLQTNVSVTTFTSPFYQILSPVSPRRKNIIDYHKTTHYDRLPLRPHYRITTIQLRPERQDDRTTGREATGRHHRDRSRQTRKSYSTRYRYSTVGLEMMCMLDWQKKITTIQVFGYKFIWNCHCCRVSGGWVTKSKHL